MRTHDSPSLRDRLFVATQYALPQHFLSRLVYRLTRSRTPTVKNALIKSFMRGFSPDLSDALQPDPLAFASFNEFFTRPLRPGARPIDPNDSILVSPVDGAISQIGHLDGSQIMQAKGHSYSLEALLDFGGSAEWASRFTDGCFATLYLAPFNYHRIHMPLNGTLRAAWYVPGQLFSVNTVTAAAVPGLFARNERVVCVFEDGPRLFAMVLVGALFVGSMDTVWHGEITPRSPREAMELPLDTTRAPLRLQKGDEMGRFNMGSTVILITAPGMIDWLSNMEARGSVSVGQPVARLRGRMMAAHG
ncbi:MAG: archaetidylserine decarboxylase [Steroidobacteraceae bacterium]